MASRSRSSSRWEQVGAQDLQVKCWLERDGDVVLSDWRVELLSAIERHGSLSAAADEFGVSYRVAWGKLHDIETRLGVRLIAGRSGGSGGGGSELTAEGRDLVERYRRFREGLDELVRARFAEAFGR